MRTPLIPAHDAPASDADLLARYLRDRSGEAFRALVDRHAGMVHAVCIRGLGRHAAMAEDAAQAVFLVLARKAGSIRDPGAVAGWLFQIARMVVLRLRRQEAGRRRRESAAAAAQKGRRPMDNRERLWAQALPYLDEAIASLRETHRAAVALHYLEGIPQEDVARRLGCAQSTVHERIVSALTHLRRFFLRKGVALPAAALATGLSAMAAPAAPVAMAAACASAGTAGAPASAAAASAAQGALKALLVAKVKVAAAFVVVASAAAGGAGMAVWPEEKPRATPAAAEAPKADPSTAPLVFWHSQPVRPNETLMLAGAYLNPGTVVEACPLPDTAPGRPPASALPDKGLGWQPLRLLQLTPQLVQAVLPAGKEGVFACRVRCGDKDGPARLVNAPDAWFAQGDQGETASPGGWIGVFGTCIALGGAPIAPGPRVEPGKKEAVAPKAASGAAASGWGGGTVSRLALATRGQTVRILTARPRGGTRYGQYFDVPADCPPGTYELFVHNGSGGPQAWTRLADHYNEQPVTTLTVAIPETWPNNGVDVSTLPGGNDDERFARAVAACKSGGILYAPAGTYRLTKPLVLPDKTLLRGNGKDKTTLEWTSDTKDGQGRHLPLISGAAVSGKNDFDKRASFSIEDLSIIASPTCEGHVIVREHTSVPAHFRRVAVRCPRQGVSPDRYVLDMRYARNTEITGCTWDAFYVIQAYKEVSHLCCTDNHFRWRGQSVSLARDHNNILFAHNRLTMPGTRLGNGYPADSNANPGFAYASHDCSNCRDLYFAHNISDREEAEPPHASIGITFDGARSAAYSGRIASVAGTKISLAGSTLGANQYRQPPCHPGASVRVVSGRGAGQWRTLTSKQTASVKELEIDRAWDVEPDAGSWLAVSNVMGRTLFVGNTFSNDPLLQTYFGTGDVVWAENVIGVTGRKVSMPVWTDVDRNVWHYHVLDNKVTEMGVDMGCAQPDWNAPKEYAGPVTGTHVYRNNRSIDAAARFAIHIPSRITGFLLEHNQGMAGIETRDVKDALGVVRQNTNLKGAVLQPDIPAAQKIVVAP